MDWNFLIFPKFKNKSFGGKFEFNFFLPTPLPTWWPFWICSIIIDKINHYEHDWPFWIWLVLVDALIIAEKVDNDRSLWAWSWLIIRDMIKSMRTQLTSQVSLTINKPGKYFKLFPLALLFHSKTFINIQIKTINYKLISED